MNRQHIFLTLFLALAMCFSAMNSAAAQNSPEDFFAAIGKATKQSEDSKKDNGDGNLDVTQIPGLDLPLGDGQSVVSNPNADFSGNNATDKYGLDEGDMLKRAIRNQAFEAALTGLFPLDVEEIRKLLKKYDETQQAVEVPVFPDPKPEIVVQTLSLDPGSELPIIKVSPGNVTVVSFIDATGAPWPIHHVSWAGNFEFINSEEGGSKVILSPMSQFANGNMSVILLELSTPILFRIETSRDTVHYRFDARVPQLGPFARTPLITGGLNLSAGNGVLGSILDGVAPPTATRLAVMGVDGRTTAYQVGSQTYVRTPLKLLSPGWSSSVSSADGMNVYSLSNAPVILLSDNGHVVRAKLSEAENLDDQ